MTPRLAQLYAVRAQVDALIVAEQAEIGPVIAEAVDPMTTCPACGADGETQQRVRTMSGRTNILCQSCKASRVVDGQSTE